MAKRAHNHWARAVEIYRHECPNESILCFYDAPCSACVEDEAFQDEQVAQHVRTCTADGFCYICQCL